MHAAAAHKCTEYKEQPRRRCRTVYMYIYNVSKYLNSVRRGAGFSVRARGV